MAEERFYFENGLTLHEACAGREVANLQLIGTAFGVSIAAREGGITISGESEAVSRASGFFAELQHFYVLRGRNMDQRDLELLLKAASRFSGKDLRDLWKERIHVSPKKRDVLPRSLKQMEYVRAMRHKELVFGIGPAGTGKTYLAMAVAVSEFLAGNCSRIILTRPARESGENLGYLPGNLEEKIMPYLRPLYDALYDMIPVEEAAELIQKGVIEVAPLAFMRGRTLGDAFIILDEAQNTSPDQMLMFLTRMGFHSRCVVTGDPTQNDLKSGEESGLLKAERTLSSLPEIEFCHFSTADVVRNALLEKIILAYTGKGGKES